MRTLLILGAIVAGTVLLTDTNSAEAGRRYNGYRGFRNYSYGFGGYGYRGRGFNRGYYPRYRTPYYGGFYSSPRIGIGFSYGGYRGFGGYGGCYGY